MDNFPPAFEQEPSPIVIRTAGPDDIPACSRLDASYKTDYVWQMRFQEGKRAIQSAFTQVRLPRTMPVNFPYPPQEMALILQRADYLQAACYHDEVVGCLGGVVEPWHRAFIITALVVHPRFRRQGVGKMLLMSAQEPAVQNNCKRLLLTVQTKNYPAIKFAQKRGFVFCGYNDRYYSNGDIALMFSLDV